MAKPRFPKKNDVKETIFPNKPLPLSGLNAAPAEVATAVVVAETRTTETRKTARKPEIVRAERANLFPINLDDEIRRLAYLLAERRGFEPGHEADDWLAAEHEVRQRYHQHSA